MQFTTKNYLEVNTVQSVGIDIHLTIRPEYLSTITLCQIMRTSKV